MCLYGLVVAAATLSGHVAWSRYRDSIADAVADLGKLPSTSAPDSFLE